MCEADEECIDLRELWKTFMVPSGENAGEAMVRECGRSHREYTLLHRYSVVGTSADEQPLFFLSLICPNPELLHATTHLFVQFQKQYRQCVVENETKMVLLRRHHEQQLTDLLEAANSDTGNMLVGSDITQRFVLKHQCELEELQEQCRETEVTMEIELRQSLLAFLKTSATGTLDAVIKESKRTSYGAGNVHSYRRVTNMSHFVTSSVPVRTVVLPNPLRHKIFGARPKDISLQPIVVDVLPTSSLQTCLHCLYVEGDDTASAVEEHLLRLSQQTHSVLLLIGSQAEAEFTLLHPSTELFFHREPVGAVDPPCFVPLGPHRYLKMLLSTRFWGANIILLWTPQKSPEIQSDMPLVIEDALNLAFSWNADMFSVALMSSAVSMPDTAYCSSLEHAQGFSMDILRQLQCGVARLAYEAPGAALFPTWNAMDISEEEEEKGDEQRQDGRGRRGHQKQDLYAAALPTSAGKLRLMFNAALAVHAFLPISLVSADRNSLASSPGVANVTGANTSDIADTALAADEGGGTPPSAFLGAHQGGESFSSDLVTATMGLRSHQPPHCYRQQQKQHATFEALLVYAFGETVMID